MNKISRFLTCLIVMNAIVPVAFSQNMNNPYSVYGIGDMDAKVYNRTSGMGGTGLAIKSSAYLIDNNPASITGLPRSFFVFNVAITGKSSVFSGDPIDETNRRSKDLWVKRIALAVKINRSWASSIGFNQFSNINYKFTGSQFVEGSTTTYETAYEGEGGLNDYYWNNAFSIGKHFSVGLKSSVIAGAINQTETLYDQTLQTVISTSQQDYIGDLRFQVGALYERPISKKWDLSLGAKYSPKAKFSSQRTMTVTENDVAVIEDDYIKTDRFDLPETIAGGIALKYNKRTTFAADYTYENWSALGVKEKGWQLISSNRISAGVEFSKLVPVMQQLMEKRFFQLGGFYGNSYLQIRNEPIREYGITAGIGGVLKNGLLYTIAVEGGSRGTTRQKLIKENYVQLSFTFSYRDLLRSKGRRFD
jgi:hypothetical protein